MARSGPPDEGEEGAGEQERRVDVHLHELLPGLRGVVFEGAESAEQGGVVHQPVEPAELGLDPGREGLVVGGHRAGEVHRVDGRLRASRRPDRIVGALELLHGAPEQHHGGGVGRAEVGDGATDAVPGPGDEDHPVFEKVRRGAEIGEARIEAHGGRTPYGLGADSLRSRRRSGLGSAEVAAPAGSRPGRSRDSTGRQRRARWFTPGRLPGRARPVRRIRRGGGTRRDSSRRGVRRAGRGR